MVESLNASQVDDNDDAASYNAMHMIRADTASPDQKREVGRDRQALHIHPARVAPNKLDASLTSEMYDANGSQQNQFYLHSEVHEENLREGAANLLKIVNDDGLSIRSSLSNESVGGLRMAMNQKPNITAAPNKFLMQQRVQ